MVGTGDLRLLGRSSENAVFSFSRAASPVATPPINRAPSKTATGRRTIQPW